MDPTSSASRDPRLNRPSLPISRLSEHGESPHRPTAGSRQYSAPALQNDAPHNQFIRGINDLMRMVYLENTCLSKKEEIQKKRSEAEGMLRRAKAQSAFPSVLDGIQHQRTELDRALTEVDDKIKNQDSQRQRLVSELGNIWATVANPTSSQAEEKVLQLQQDVKLANEKITSLNSQIANLISHNKSVDGQLKGLRDKLDEQQSIISVQQRSFGSYTDSLTVTKNDVDELRKDLIPLKKGLDDNSSRVKHLEERPVQKRDGMNLDAQKALDDFSIRFKSLEQKSEGFAEKIESLSSPYQKLSGLLDQVDVRFKEQQEKLTNQQQKLDQLGSSGMSNSNLSKVQSDILSINNRFEMMRGILSEKDDLQFKEMETLQESFKELKQAQTHLSEMMKETVLRTPKEPLDTKINGLLTEVRGFHEQVGQIEVVNMAIQSLETRYNNVSTEGLAQHMLGAMRELYPIPDKIIGDLTGHAHELVSLRQKVDQLDTKGTMSPALQNELRLMKAAHENLRTSVVEFKQRHQGIDPQQVLSIQTRLDALAEKQSTTDGALHQKQADDDALVQKVKDENQSLHSRVKSLQGDLAKLNSEFNQAKPAAGHDEEGLHLLETRIEALEQSTTQGYDKLKAQVDRIKKTVRHQNASSERASAQPDASQSQRAQPPPRPDLLDGSLGMRIKRRYPSDEERSPAPSHSPNPTGSSTLAQSDARKKKKKKKPRLESQALTQAQVLSRTPIEIDD
ncbi:uncharacterized protein BDV14DRAFT_147577 [Aspergillus stella-maris]|uniref:uncharacterized protein n=1 Tax=Aspergillus stella-maris TaxID=1810926 RepID=UPI003CCD4C56